MPTSEQIEKAYREGHQDGVRMGESCYEDDHWLASDARFALSAAEGVKPRVKPLVWEKIWVGPFDDIPGWSAKTPWGQIHFSASGMRKEDGSPYREHRHLPRAFVTEKKAAAQADYEARILSALQEGE